MLYSVQLEEKSGRVIEERRDRGDRVFYQRLLTAELVISYGCDTKRIKHDTAGCYRKIIVDGHMLPP